MVKFLVTFAVLLISFASMGMEISPSETDSKIRMVRGPHQAFIPKDKGTKTVIMIGGTGSRPSDYMNILLTAQGKGYRVLGVDYENEVISTVCRESSNRHCFDSFRAEIVFGNPESDLVKVNERNSIAYRILKLTQYLGWKVEWEDVILIGHSQGAGHVAYLAKHFNVHKVIMLGGPQDYFTSHGPANWTLDRGETSPARFYSFLHEKDFFGVDMQIALARVLMGHLNMEIQKVADEIPADSRSRIFVTDLPMPDPHNSFWNPAFKKIWDKLL